MLMLRFYLSIAHRPQSTNHATATKAEEAINLPARAYRSRGYGTRIKNGSHELGDRHGRHLDQVKQTKALGNNNLRSRIAFKKLRGYVS